MLCTLIFGRKIQTLTIWYFFWPESLNSPRSLQERQDGPTGDRPTHLLHYICNNRTLRYRATNHMNGNKPNCIHFFVFVLLLYFINDWQYLSRIFLWITAWETPHVWQKRFDLTLSSSKIKSRKQPSCHTVYLVCGLKGLVLFEIR